MARRVVTLAELAEEAGLDYDETLLHLWEAGLERYNGPKDRLRRRDLDVALRAVGLPTGKDLSAPEYWMRRLGLDRVAFRGLLADLGTPMGNKAQTLPKGAVMKLKRFTSHRPSASAQEVRQARVEEPIEEPFEWRTVGRQRNARLLTEEEVEAIHWELVQDFARDADPIVPPGVRSPDLLASAVFRQHTSLGEEVKYPTVEMAAAALFHAVVHDHPFFNGNKRTALVSMLVLLDENGIVPTCEEDELFQLVLRLAQHRVVKRGRDLADREVIHIAEWLHGKSRHVEKGERPIQWRKLRQILGGFDCELRQPAGVGNRMNIHRIVGERGLFGRPRKRSLVTQVRYTDDGREAMIDTVKKIRRDLWLDESHGTDSLDFYQRGGPSPSEFIMKYRKTLKRLAHL